jgi:uncharacterized protein (TIGR00251 family)
MKLEITVKTNAGRNEVRVGEGGSLTVLVSVPPAEGKANERVIELLSRHLKKPKSAIRIVRGRSSRKKLIEVG